MTYVRRRNSRNLTAETITTSGAASLASLAVVGAATVGTTLIVTGDLTGSADFKGRIQFMGGGNTVVANDTRYFTVSGEQVCNNSENRTQVRVQRTMTFKNLRCKTLVAAGAGQSYVFTLRKNGVDTALTVTISGGAETTDEDVANSVAFVAGDLINMKIVSSATAAATDSSISIDAQIT